MNALLTALAPLFSTAFSLWGAVVSWLEVVAFILAIWMVVCNMRVDPKGWPLAIISSLLYFLLFWKSRLYGDASLQLVFVVVAAWGWWQWVKGSRSGVLSAADSKPSSPPAASSSTSDEASSKVRWMTSRARWTVVLTLVVMWPLVGLFLLKATDTDVPWFDAFPTTASLIGQCLLGQKFVENWPMWVVVNLVSTGLFAYKGLWLTTILYAIFLAMSFAGWRAWKRLAEHKAASDHDHDGLRTA